MADKDLSNEQRELIKYKKAFHYLLDYWDCFQYEQREIINRDLNKIFGKNHGEYMGVD